MFATRSAVRSRDKVVRQRKPLAGSSTNNEKEASKDEKRRSLYSEADVMCRCAENGKGGEETRGCCRLSPLFRRCYLRCPHALRLFAHVSAWSVAAFLFDVLVVMLVAVLAAATDEEMERSKKTAEQRKGK